MCEFALKDVRATGQSVCSGPQRDPTVFSIQVTTGIVCDQRNQWGGVRSLFACPDVY